MKRSDSSDAPRVVLAVTSAQSLKLMTGFPEYLSGQGWDVHVVTSSAPANDYPDEVSMHLLPMVREPSPMRDLASLWAWVRLLRRLRPDLVVAGTPKAGLLGIVSAFVVRVPARIYLLRGLRLEGEQGVKRRILWVMEWISSRLATKVQAVSTSLRQEFIERGLSRPEKIVVLGDGSSNGVELVELSGTGDDAREMIGLDRDTPVVGFVGRLSRDKGLLTLLTAVHGLHTRGVTIQTLLVGPEEPKGSLAAALAEADVDDSRVVWIGAVPDARAYYRAMDVLCLPTRREGFPNVVLEAAAQGVPAIVSRATGAVDSVADGETGWLFDVGDSNGLEEQLERLMADPQQLVEAGLNARKHVSERFDRAKVWARTNEFFRQEAGLSTKQKERI